jgi:hypothetical protein
LVLFRTTAVFQQDRRHALPDYPDGDPLTYIYATTGGQISGNGPT